MAEYTIKKKGGNWVAYDKSNVSLGKISIKTGKFTGDTKVLVLLSDYHTEMIKMMNKLGTGRKNQEVIIGIDVHPSLNEKDIAKLREIIYKAIPTPFLATNDIEAITFKKVILRNMIDGDTSNEVDISDLNL